MTYQNANSYIPPGNEVMGRDPKFFGRVMTWLAGSFIGMIFGAAVLGPIIPASMLMPLYLVTLGVLIVSAFAKGLATKIAGPLAIAVPTVLGAVIYPTLDLYFSNGMGNVVIQAAVGALVIFGSMAVWGYTTQKDLSGWYKPMFFILLGVIAMSLLNAFIFHNSMGSFLISVAVVIVFSIYSVMDVQSLKKAAKYGTTTPAASYALNIFLDIFNLFVALLRIFSPR